MADLAGVTVITEDELDSSTLAIAIEKILSMSSSSSKCVLKIFRFENYSTIFHEAIPYALLKKI